MKYNFSEIEQKWKQYWTDHNTYAVANTTDKPKHYVLDMFPYPSGAGLHVGHPLGYIASDIYARFKRMQGFNVLHPMGFDAFGLPAEQYALDTGQHPAVTTEKNIARYKEQLNNIGFNYDWSREVQTSDPKYYKWTQWIFSQLFHSWYNNKTQKAAPIADLITIFEQEGNAGYPSPKETEMFNAETWNAYDEAAKRHVLMQYRLAYLDYAEVWWCAALATVLANDEVVNGVSERGGHPVEKKKMRQWFLRITDYADNLLSSLDHLEWSEAMKEMQRNWIGKSEGAQIGFSIAGTDHSIEVFTTRPDTIFGVDFMVLAPEHELILDITTAAQKEAVESYITYVKSRSERERMAEKKISGCFTGAYAVHPFSGKQIPIWISEYVLAGYGTGAIMAVPSGDERDFAFANHFNIPITNIFGDHYTGEHAFTDKNVSIENSDFISGLSIAAATEAVLTAVAEKGIGKRTTNFRLRDAGFSRQRYWGEPFPIVYKNDIPYTIDEPELALQDADKTLPVLLPHVDTYKPGPNGEGPLANIDSFVHLTNSAGEILRRETNTMPGYAGSSWYFLRYMDPHNDTEFVGADTAQYWNQVDLYIGGTEHAVGHLLYSRFWTKVLYDLGHIGFNEPFKKLLNQGMIQGSSRFVYRLNTSINKSNKNTFTGQVTEDKGAINPLLPSVNPNDNPIIFVSESIAKKLRTKDDTEAKTIIDDFLTPINKGLSEKYNGKAVYISTEYIINAIHVDVSMVDGVELDIEQFKQWRAEYNNAEFILEDGKYICGAEVEKMSKSKYNVVNPDEIVAQYGADTFRMYEMFLGPIEMSKPWDTKGIEGVHRFLKKLWRLFFEEQQEQTQWLVVDEEPTKEELKALHKTIKKVADDIEKFSFNTTVSQFMIITNELHELKCHKRAILEPLVALLAPFAPHVAEELWQRLGHDTSVAAADFPKFEEQYITESAKLYPIAINGKHRTNMEFALDAATEAIEQEVLANEIVQKWLEGKPHKKIIFVKGKMINVIV
ncbi:leucine--tRNA ligase [Taibaiella sp. KBW10]|uniref:leucine--tRNA ligase n=1 Tax=Taibaiella sp. KBW10 TaxID=2153357 RepID=UPI000F5A786F|nr:class I tRNA ligase family protein [Taibaiella sp. KBW10]RQO31003.1 leucine--tRNA ligase [Taibaiella sp. KBW10]